MVRRINVLREVRKPTRCAIDEVGDVTISDWGGCRHALWLAHGVYCALRREKLDGSTCEGCPHFDREPLGYRLFRRM